MRLLHEIIEPPIWKIKQISFITLIMLDDQTIVVEKDICSCLENLTGYDIFE